MAYPTSIKSFTFKRNNIDKVVADDVNTAYTEITEIERQLGEGGVTTSTWGTGTFATTTTNWYSVGGLQNRLKNIEAGLYQALVTGTINALVTGTINGTTIPTSKTLVVTTDKLSVHAATTSAELLGVISDETGTGSLVFGTAPTLSGLKLSAGTSSVAPLTFNQGPILSPAAGGTVDYIGTTALFTPDVSATSGRGILPAVHFYTLAPNGTPSSLTVNTTAQSIFGKGLPLAASTTYEVEMNIVASLNSNSTNANTISITSTGATMTGFTSGAIGSSGGTTNDSIFLSGSSNAVTSTSATLQTVIITVKAIVITSSAVTFTPQIKLGTTNATSWQILQSSWIKVTPVGSSTVTGVGAWA